MQQEIGRYGSENFVFDSVGGQGGAEVVLLNDLNCGFNSWRNFQAVRNIPLVSNVDRVEVDDCLVSANTTTSLFRAQQNLDGTTGCIMKRATVNENATIVDSLTVDGNITVQGNLSTLTAMNVVIQDNEIVLNTAFSSEPSGFAVERYQPASSNSLEGDVVSDTAFETNNAIDGGTDYITLDPPEVRSAGFYDDWYVSLVSGDGMNDVRTISQYLGNGQAYVNEPWTTAPTVSTVYELHPGKFVSLVWDNTNARWDAGQSLTVSNISTIRRKSLKVNNISIKGNVIAKGSVLAPITPGTTVAFAGATIPSGWLECDGTNYDELDYPGLFAVIGNTYGESGGPGTFNVPNLQNRIPTGMDVADPSFNSLGKTKPSDNTSLTLTTPQIAPHTHMVPFGSSGPLTHAHETSLGTTHSPSGSVSTNTLPTPSQIAGAPQQHSHGPNANTVTGSSSHTHGLTAGGSTIVSGANVTGSSPNNVGPIARPVQTDNAPHGHNTNVTTYTGGTINTVLGRAPVNGTLIDSQVELTPTTFPTMAPGPNPAMNSQRTISGPGNHAHGGSPFAPSALPQHSHPFPHTHGTNVTGTSNMTNTAINVPHTHNLLDAPTLSHPHEHTGPVQHFHFSSQTTQIGDGTTIVNTLDSHTHAGPTDATGSGDPVSILSPYLVLKYIIKC